VTSEFEGSPKTWPPLGLPTGSVRALLTLIVVSVVITQLSLNREVNPLWTETLLIALAHYFKGEFAAAAVAMQNARDAAKDDNALVGPSDWLYMSLRRAGKMARSEFCE